MSVMVAHPSRVRARNPSAASRSIGGSTSPVAGNQERSIASIDAPSLVQVIAQHLVGAVEAAELVVDELVELTGERCDGHRLAHAPPALDGGGQVLQPQERRRQVLPP